MNKDLQISLLDEIVKHCETIKQLQENFDQHKDLKKILKENYNLTSEEVLNVVQQVNNKFQKIDTKQIEKLNEKIISLCKIVDISPFEKDIEKLNYSKIRIRVSNKKHNLTKRNQKN